MKLRTGQREHRRKNIGRTGIAAAGLAIAGVAGLAIAQTTPALADPTLTYVAVGSDTTQGIINQVSLDLGSNTLGSYDAVNPVTGAAHEVVTPVKTTGTLCSFSRPNGSGEGVAALRYSVNSASGATPPAPLPQAGCADIARSSSGPGSNASTTGQFVYVPFALDAVGGVTGPATGGTVVGGVTTVATQITTADSFTLTDLKTLYANCGQVTEGGITYWPFEAGVTQPPGTQRIDLYVSAPGSGLLTFWAGVLGFNATTLPVCVSQTIVQGADAGTATQTDDGTAVATDADGFSPFSIADWIGQRNGHSDRRHGAVVHNLNSVSPFSNGNPATGTLNTAFPITREVYNVVQFSRVSGATADPGLVAMLVGTNSFLCQDSLNIKSFGFATLGATTPDTCGSTASTLRAFANG